MQDMWHLPLDPTNDDPAAPGARITPIVPTDGPRPGRPSSEVSA